MQLVNSQLVIMEYSYESDEDDVLCTVLKQADIIPVV